MFFPGERLRADFAGMRRIAGVLFQVICQVFLTSKRLLTELATMWRLSCMDSVETIELI
jgi:hypothetical protein